MYRIIFMVLLLLPNVWGDVLMWASCSNIPGGGKDIMSTFNPKDHHTFDEYMRILVERADDTWVTSDLKPQVIQHLKTLESDSSQSEDSQKRILGCLAEMGDDAATTTILSTDHKPTDDLSMFYAICLRHATPAQMLPYHLKKLLREILCVITWCHLKRIWPPRMHFETSAIGRYFLKKPENGPVKL